MAKQVSPLFGDDVKKVRRIVADKLQQAAKLLREIDEAVEAVAADYDYQEDVFNDCLPLNSYPFSMSFDELPAAIDTWRQDILKMNDTNTIYNTERN